MGKKTRKHDNAWSQTAKLVKETITALGWEGLPHPLYSPDLASFANQLFSSMGHALAEQHFDSYAEVEKLVSEWFAS